MAHSITCIPGINIISEALLHVSIDIDIDQSCNLQF